MADAAPYIAELKGVCEVALHGTADAAWWRERLADEGLEPLAEGGRARVLVTGLDGRWLLWPVRDLSVAVAARRAGADETGVFFARAFNASRFLVFFEAHWFKLPYARRPVRATLDGDGGASLRLGAGEFVAEMAARDGGEAAPTTFELPLYLPGRRWLRVKVEGDTTVHPYDDARDRFEVRPDCADPVFAGLAASGFRGLEWHLRPRSNHARTKTLGR